MEKCPVVEFRASSSLGSSVITLIVVSPAYGTVRVAPAHRVERAGTGWPGLARKPALMLQDETGNSENSSEKAVQYEYRYATTTQQRLSVKRIASAA